MQSEGFVEKHEILEELDLGLNLPLESGILSKFFSYLELYRSLSNVHLRILLLIVNRFLKKKLVYAKIIQETFNLRSEKLVWDKLDKLLGLSLIEKVEMCPNCQWNYSLNPLSCENPSCSKIAFLAQLGVKDKRKVPRYLLFLTDRGWRVLRAKIFDDGRYLKELNNIFSQ